MKMCRLIQVVHFGCEEKHSEEVLVRCKAGLEYMLNMPITEVCKGMVQVEDWVMSPCRFCKEYEESRTASGSVVGRTRAVSLQESHRPSLLEDDVRKAATCDDCVTPGRRCHES